MYVCNCYQQLVALIVCALHVNTTVHNNDCLSLLILCIIFSTGELINRLSSDTQVIQNALTVSLFCDLGLTGPLCFLSFTITLCDVENNFISYSYPGSLIFVYFCCFQVNVSMLLRYIFQIIGSLVFMFTLSPKLTGVLISVVPIVGVGAQQYGTVVNLLLACI